MFCICALWYKKNDTYTHTRTSFPSRGGDIAPSENAWFTYFSMADLALKQWN